MRAGRDLGHVAGPLLNRLAVDDAGDLAGEQHGGFGRHGVTLARRFGAWPYQDARHAMAHAGKYLVSHQPFNGPPALVDRLDDEGTGRSLDYGHRLTLGL